MPGKQAMTLKGSFEVFLKEPQKACGATAPRPHVRNGQPRPGAMQRGGTGTTSWNLSLEKEVASSALLSFLGRVGTDGGKA